MSAERIYGLNETVIPEPTELIPTGGLKDDYNRKFYIVGLTILVSFVLFMVYGALHEVDEDIIDYDGRRRRKREKRQRRRERKRLSRPHPCMQRAYDVTLAEHELLCSLRLQYGCKCKCVCNIPVLRNEEVPLSGSGESLKGDCLISQEPSPTEIPFDGGGNYSHNNNCNVKRVFQSSDPAKKMYTIHRDEDIWVKRKSLGYPSEIDDDLLGPVDDELFRQTSETTGCNATPSEKYEDYPSSSDRLSKWQTKFGRRKESSSSSTTADDEINLITFSSIEESPLHAKRITSGNIYKASVDKYADCEEIWRKRTSLDRLYEYSTL